MKHVILSAMAAMCATPALANPPAQIAQVEVLPGWSTRDGTRIAALQVTLAPGWKTYWRAPGDGGIPPQFSWAGSSNIATTSFHWPVPEVFHQNGMRSIGYHEGVVIPVEFTATDPDAPIHMAGQLDIGVCEEICVPVTLSFDADLPVSGDRDTTITASLINRPLSAQEAGVGAVHCAVQADEHGLIVTTTVAMSTAGQNEDVVIETGDPHVWVSEPAVARIGDQLTATVDMRHSSGEAFALDMAAVRITVLGSNHAVDIHGCG